MARSFGSTRERSPATRRCASTAMRSSGKMKLIMETGRGAKQEQVIPWGKDVRGPYAAEQSMARKPMEEGETRAFKMYIPDLNRVVDFTFKAGPTSEIALGDGSRRALRKVAADRLAGRQAAAGPRLRPLGRLRRPGLEARDRHDGRHRHVSHHQGGGHRPPRLARQCPVRRDPQHHHRDRQDHSRSSPHALRPVSPDAQGWRSRRGLPRRRPSDDPARARQELPDPQRGHGRTHRRHAPVPPRSMPSSPAPTASSPATTRGSRA